MKTVLTVAGFDPTGGAGIQADLRTFEKFGAMGVGAVTAITAQTHKRFLSVYPAPADILTQQLSGLSEDFVFDAVKIGMLATAANVQALIFFLKRLHGVPIVVDPVFDSSSGYPLLEPDAISVLENHLLPLATVVTPNLMEAETLAGMHVSDLQTMKTAAEAIHENIRKMRGGGDAPLAVVVTGGHLQNTSTDILFDGKTVTEIEGEYVSGSMHGSGCRYSSAVAAMLAAGNDILTAARKAKLFVAEEIKNENYGSSAL